MTMNLLIASLTATLGIIFTGFNNRGCCSPSPYYNSIDVSANTGGKLVCDCRNNENCLFGNIR